ncbi:hypothetical protein [Sphingosinicella sp. CPCC 101087]|uniref:hypothetical protein n=1 Tax=Sphingosinicella sp. CPCC 101087 TaxID=2497754 RepID=UPI00101DDD7F|nr:hypothetical protein [Sphingosinicella sp. CPCC 101087]
MNRKSFRLAPLLACLSSAALAQADVTGESAGPAPALPEAAAVADPDANSQAAPDIGQIRAAAAPLVALPLDLTQASDPIWVRGERPSANLIAAMRLRPIGAVAVEQDLGQGEGPLILWKAVTGDLESFVSEGGLVEAADERLYCADGPGPKRIASIICLIDDDGDGRFEAEAKGLGETTPRVAELSLVGPSSPLPEPIPYRAASEDELPGIDVEYRNCARDHDRPRFNLGARSDAPVLTPAEIRAVTPDALRNDPELARRMMEMAARIRTGGLECRRAESLEEGNALHPGNLERGAVAARLDELLIAVGPRDDGAPVRLLGLRNPKRLYRLSGIAVAPLSEGMTSRQNSLAVAQRFERPVLMLAAAPDVSEGTRAAGDVLFTADLRHGYMGVLTQDTVIRTLFSSRSLPAGTALYGIPMGSRRITTVNGVPVRGGAQREPGPDDVRLVWCAPVEDEGRWTATCLPSQPDRYTLLRGQTPAFEVRSFSYAAGTSTNDGPVPVVQRDGDFGRPLRYRFTLQAVEAERVVVTKETLFGEEVVHSRPIHVPRHPDRVGAIGLAGGIVSLAVGTDGGVQVRQVRDFTVGGDVLAVDAGLVPEAAAPRSEPVAAPEAG